MNKPLEREAGKARAQSHAGPPPVVLQIVPRLSIGGVERGTVDIATALREAGARSLVVSSGGEMVRELERAGVEHITLPSDTKNPVTMAANARRLARIVGEKQVDILHARSRAPAWSAWRAARATKRPLVTTFHGTYGLGNKVKQRYNAVMTRGARVIAISDFIAEHVQRIYKTDPAHITVIHRGVDTAVFDPKLVPPARIIQLSNRWRLPDGVPVVMLPGRLTRWKGQTVFVEALAKLQRRDLCAVIVGPNQGRTAYSEELEDMVRDRDLGSVARLVDETRDMPAALMLADIVVSASTDPEAFGRVIAEAGAMGRPVIASDHGGAREQIIEGETGWLVPPGDADALAAAIERALSVSKIARASMAKLAMKRVRENFSKASMCEKTLALYREVAAEATAGRE